MSASRASSVSKSSRPARRAPKKKERRTTAADLIPWRAISDLAEWAFDLAERDVADWPIAHQRVRNTRRYVLARIDGKQPGKPASDEDLVFTAALLARLLEEQLELDYVDTASVLDRLELPIDDVPVRPRSRNAATVDTSHVAKSCTFRASSAPPAPPPLRFCDACGYVHELGSHVGYRNAA